MSSMERAAWLLEAHKVEKRRELELCRGVLAALTDDPEYLMHFVEQATGSEQIGKAARYHAKRRQRSRG